MKRFIEGVRGVREAHAGLEGHRGGRDGDARLCNDPGSH